MLRAAGFGKGDVIGLYMPMSPEVVIALLAIAKIGAVILPLFSGFGQATLPCGKPVTIKPVAEEALARAMSRLPPFTRAARQKRKQDESSGSRYWRRHRRHPNLD